MTRKKCLGEFNSDIASTQGKQHFLVNENIAFPATASAKWSANYKYLKIVREVRQYYIAKRPLYILTSGPVAATSLQSVLLELQTATAVAAEFPLPDNRLFWQAFNSGLTVAQAKQWRQCLAQQNMQFNAVPSLVSSLSVAGMYAARQLVFQYIQQLPKQAIICWLDSDLAITALVPSQTNTDNLSLYQAWPWLHLVWHYAEYHPNINVAIGDVVGDPPVPASSTLLTNLKDIRAAITQSDSMLLGLQRWKIPDPAYDLTELKERTRANYNFPLLCLDGDFNPLEHGLINALLWSGTVARPLVADPIVMYNPHRPWYIRGGVTILLKPSARKTPLPHLYWAAAPCRRADSFWMLKACSAKTAGHFAYPLLHRREAFVGDLPALIASFKERGMTDLIGASAIKAAGKNIGNRLLSPTAIEAQLSDRVLKSTQCLSQAQQVLHTCQPFINAQTYDAVYQACVELINESLVLPVAECAHTLSEQINYYLIGESR